MTQSALARMQIQSQCMFQLASGWPQLPLTCKAIDLAVCHAKGIRPGGRQNHLGKQSGHVSRVDLVAYSKTRSPLPQTSLIFQGTSLVPDNSNRTFDLHPCFAPAALLTTSLYCGLQW